MRERLRQRNQSGIGLIEVFLAVTITALIAVPVFGTLIVVLKTGGTSGSAISGQNARVAAQFDRNLKTIAAETAFREDWRVASIIKVNPPVTDAFSQGIFCNQTPGTNIYIASLQRKARYGQDDSAPVFTAQFPNGAGKPLDAVQEKGMIRVVYHLAKQGTETFPDGSPVYDLYRRECAVNAGASPLAVRSTPLADCPDKVKAGNIDVDCAGWRLQPGSINSGFASDALGNVAEPCPAAWVANPKQNWPLCWASGSLPPTVVYEDVKSVSAKRLSPPSAGASATSANPSAPSALPGMAAGTCNDRLAQNQTVNGVTTLRQYDTKCDVEFTIVFGDGRTQVIRLYQGFSS
jgi:hypothetical protein